MSQGMDAVTLSLREVETARSRVQYKSGVNVAAELFSPERKDAPWISRTSAPNCAKRQRRAQPPEELLALAKREGYKLTAEQLEAVSGGGGWSTCTHAYSDD